MIKHKYLLKKKTKYQRATAASDIVVLSFGELICYDTEIIVNQGQCRSSHLRQPLAC